MGRGHVSVDMFARLSVVFSSLVFSAIAGAGVLSGSNDYYPESFYTDVDNGLRGEDLKKEIFDILTQVHIHTGGHDEIVKACPKGGNADCYSRLVLTYTEARRMMFGKIHLENTGNGYGVKDVYCQKMTTRADYRSQPPGPNQIPDVEVMNTEHTWPQSRFSNEFSKDMQKSDLNILYPVLTNANSARSNFKFGNVTSTVNQPCKESKLGYSANGGGELYFEPSDAHKGNAARAVFYFSVRYKLHITEEEETSLRAWNAMDPVDEAERTRNDLVFDAQKERNPFIDHPELVDLISDF